MLAYVTVSPMPEKLLASSTLVDNLIASCYYYGPGAQIWLVIKCDTDSLAFVNQSLIDTC